MATRNLVEGSKRPVKHGRESSLSSRQRAAASLLAGGYTRNQVVDILTEHDLPDELPSSTIFKKRRVRNSKQFKLWFLDHRFRDRVYELSLADLDMSSPDILKALGKQSKKGNVSAIRLALEVTGRHDPHADRDFNPVVQVVFNGIPRPKNRPALATGDTYDADPGDVDEVTGSTGREDEDG